MGDRRASPPGQDGAARRGLQAAAGCHRRRRAGLRPDRARRARRPRLRDVPEGLRAGAVVTMSAAPVRCPAIEHPDVPLASPADLDPLLARLAAAAPVETDESFPVGTLRPDGRADLCKQGLGPGGTARLLPAAVASSHAIHLPPGTNAMGDEGAAAVATALAPGHRIQTVYLGCNRISEAGVTALAARLAD